MTGVRYFDFDRSTTRAEAIRAIVAALADEGLALTDSDNGTASRITTVLVDGVKRVVVPRHRIVLAAPIEPRLEVIK